MTSILVTVSQKRQVLTESAWICLTPGPFGCDWKWVRIKPGCDEGTGATRQRPFPSPRPSPQGRGSACAAFERIVDRELRPRVWWIGPLGAADLGSSCSAHPDSTVTRSVRGRQTGLPLPGERAGVRGKARHDVLACLPRFAFPRISNHLVHRPHPLLIAPGPFRPVH